MYRANRARFLDEWELTINHMLAKCEALEQKAEHFHKMGMCFKCADLYEKISVCDSENDLRSLAKTLKTYEGIAEQWQ